MVRDMAKTAQDRVNQTVNCDWPDDVFRGYNIRIVRKLLDDAVRHHLSNAEFAEISGIMSLGGVRVFKRQVTTDLRHLKRLAILFHHVLGYHSFAETAQFREMIKGLDLPAMTVVARNQVERALQMVINRELWAREIVPRNGGRCLHYYSQGNDQRLKAMDMTENGWCLGMSVQWLADKKNRLDFWSRHGTPEQASKYRFVMAGQALRTKRFAGSDTRDRSSFRLRREGLALIGETRERADTSSLRLASLIAANPSPFARIGQYYVGGGGHAMAAHVDGGGISFLDPNLGEYFFSDPGKFRNWFRLFCRFMGYRFTEFYVEAFRENRAPMDVGLAAALNARRRVMLGGDEDY